MNLVQNDRQYWVNHGTVEHGVQQNLGIPYSFRALSKSGLSNSFNSITYHGSTTDTSSPGTSTRPMSISEWRALDERSSKDIGPFNPAGWTYAPHTQLKHSQPAGTHDSHLCWFDERCQRPSNNWYQPVQMVVPSPSYRNMIRILSPASPMKISQSWFPGTSQVWNNTNYHTRAMLKNTPLEPVFTSQHTIIDPAGCSFVAHSSQPQSIVSSIISSAPLENFVSSPHQKSYYNINKPVLSFAFSVGALEVPPVVESNRQEMQAKDGNEHILFSISTDPMLPNGVTSGKTPHEGNIPCCALMNLKSPSQNLSCEASEKILGKVQNAMEPNQNDLWPGICTYVESEQNSGATLFVTWFSSRALLVGKLRYFKLEVKHIHSTSDNKVFNVVFDSHSCARKAFTMQQTIQVRMVPPKKSNFKWFRNPSPKFLVKFETKRPMTITNGKAETRDIVGVLQLPNSKEQKRCFVWADQLKGNRIRIVGYEGSLKYKDGTVVEMTGISNKFEGYTDKEGRWQSIGWVSYRSKYTNEMFVKRRSGNILSDYVYRG